MSARASDGAPEVEFPSAQPVAPGRTSRALAHFWRRRGRLGGLVAAVWAVGWSTALAGPALAAPLPALPPDGAGADTPGTSSSVWPTSLAPCATINFSVSGYPAGETVYVKIDDGIGYGDTSVQGSGVWHSQAISNSGRVSGSFELPCDITPGGHWLRFLASAYVDPSDPNKGVIGYTRRGGADFTVVAADGAGNSGSGTGSGSTAAGSNAGTVTGAGAEQVGGQGGVLGIDPDLVPAPSASPVGSPSAGATGPTSGPEPTDGLIAPPATDRSQLPFGLIGGGLVVLVAGAAAVMVWRRGRSQSGAGLVDGPGPGIMSGPAEKSGSGDGSGPGDGSDPGSTPDPESGPGAGDRPGPGESPDDRAGPGTAGL
ncbi:MAG: hypothetical protein LBL55_11025 [Propionibacteriaceae bacterium]|jgi:hypothetical protein|nr:hypothetical protein [Propionibacteriaceae bacterium]